MFKQNLCCGKKLAPFEEYEPGTNTKVCLTDLIKYFLPFNSHYSKAIEMFGPCLSYWTGRFESKHRVAKNTAETAKNVKNITKTISERQQMRAVSVFYRGMFNFSPYILPEAVMKKSEISDESSFNVTLKAFMGDCDLICKSILVNDQNYENGDLIVLDLDDCDSLTVGHVQTILIKDFKVYFVVLKFKATRNFLQYFESDGSVNPISEFIESHKIVDHKPLIKRGTINKFVFVLHHHVSFNYM